MRNKIENENNTSKLGSILSVLIVVTVFSQFEGAAFEGAARVLMYGSWMAMFAIFCIKFKEISRTRYLILTGFAVMLLLIESFIANVVIDNYNPPLLLSLIHIFGVLERGTEVRELIEECNCGKCCEPGDYVEVADIIRWFIELSLIHI